LRFIARTGRPKRWLKPGCHRKFYLGPEPIQEDRSKNGEKAPFFLGFELRKPRKRQKIYLHASKRRLPKAAIRKRRISPSPKLAIVRQPGRFASKIKGEAFAIPAARIQRKKMNK
jgi:hypothetical protein